MSPGPPNGHHWVPLLAPVALTLVVVAAVLFWSNRSQPGPAKQEARPVQATNASAPSADAAGEHVCLSLRELSSVLDAAARSGGVPPDEANRLGGIGWIEGYVLDRDGADVILYGTSRPERPEIPLDDLTVLLAAMTAGRQHTYCSLDPRPEEVVALRQLAADTGSSDLGESLARFQRSIGPQKVVVGGVPRDSHAARVMVEADYHMKKVSQGHVEAPGVVSVLELELRGGHSRLAGVTMSRFWFHVEPGHPTFRTDEGIVEVDNCPVVVLTERQASTADGRLVDVPNEDPLAAAFASNMSQTFGALTAKVPVYAELENLFRLWSLAEAFRVHGMDDPVASEVVTRVAAHGLFGPTEMPDYLPGLTNWKEVGGSGPGGRPYIAMVAGGVDMDMGGKAVSFEPGGPPLADLRRRILGTRPSGSSLAWATTGRPLSPRPRASLSELAARFADEGVAFAWTTENPDGTPAPVVLHLGARELAVAPEEFETWLAGRGGLDDLDNWMASGASGKRSLVLSIEGLGTGLTEKLVQRLPDAFRARYPAGRLFLARHVDLVAENLASLKTIEGPGDVLALVPDEGFGVRDDQVISEMVGTLRELGMSVEKEINVVHKGDVIIVAGHKDEALREFLEAAGRAGALAGKSVVLFSCYATTDVDFNSRLIGEYQARSVQFIADTIVSPAVSEVTVALAQLLHEGRVRGTLGEVIAAAVARARENTARQPGLRKQIEKLLRSWTQISRNEEPRLPPSFLPLKGAGETSSGQVESGACG